MRLCSADCVGLYSTESRYMIDAVQVGSARCNLHGAAFWLLTDKGESEIFMDVATLFSPDVRVTLLVVTLLVVDTVGCRCWAN